MLEYRNTPIGNVASPAQILMSRRLRSHLPTTRNQLQPKVVDPERMKEKFEEKQTKQKRYYDRGSTELPAVQEEETVRVQNKWKPAVIKKKLEETEIISESRSTVFRNQDRGNQLKISSLVVPEKFVKNKSQSQVLDNIIKLETED